MNRNWLTYNFASWKSFLNHVTFGEGLFVVLCRGIRYCMGQGEMGEVRERKEMRERERIRTQHFTLILFCDNWPAPVRMALIHSSALMPRTPPIRLYFLTLLHCTSFQIHQLWGAHADHNTEYKTNMSTLVMETIEFRNFRWEPLIMNNLTVQNYLYVTMVRAWRISGTLSLCQLTGVCSSAQCQSLFHLAMAWCELQCFRNTY